MTVVIRFSGALGAWIADGLESGWPPATLVLTLMEERLDAGIARVLVEAFAAARKSRRPLPAGAVTVEKVALGAGIDAWTGSAAHAAWRSAITVIHDGDATGSVR